MIETSTRFWNCDDMGRTLDGPIQITYVDWKANTIYHLEGN